MLKKVLGKGKKTNSPHEDEPVKKKRSTRGSSSGKGGSSQQQAPQPQEQQQGLSYVASLVANYPTLLAYQHPWSDRFYHEGCKKRGKFVDYSDREINRFLGAVVPNNCLFYAVKDEIEGWPLEVRNPVKEFLGRPGTE
ncbi:hypothetical protein A2U01_0038132, partial [Trifolium medium]|nr:hypothetical protein [Trifolium medium]